MKKSLKILSMLLIFTLVFTTMGLSVFAVGEEGDTEEPAVTTQAEETPEVVSAPETPTEPDTPAAPDTPDEPQPVTFTVKFNMNGHGAAVADQTVNEGACAVKPADPSEEGWTFGGWLYNGSEWDFSKVVESDMTLVAKWTEIPLEIKSVSLAPVYDAEAGTYNVTVSWTFNKTYAGESKVEVFKDSKDGEPLEDPAPVVTGGTSAEFTLPADGSVYYFKVTAGTATGWSARFAASTAAPAVKNLTAYAADDTISLFWSADPNADRYEVYRKSGSSWVLIGEATNDDLASLPAAAGVAEQRVNFVTGKLDRYTTYTFKVVAINSIGSKDATVSKQPVRPINYKMTVKISKVTLSSHAGKSRSITKKKGDSIKAYGFGGGYYYFRDGDSIFRIAKAKCKSITADYTKSMNYSKADAENYVNSEKIKEANGTGALIWVSTYCQHVYYFTGTTGNWKCVKDWECATGKAISPTPTGLSGEKFIGAGASVKKDPKTKKKGKAKYSKRNGLKWWSTFSDLNAFHGKLGSWKVGTPASGGCIRNANDNAKYIYDKAKNGTKVMIN